MSPRRAARRRRGTVGRLLAPILLGLAGCATFAPATEADARASAQRTFETVLADAGWPTDRFAPATVTPTDIGWMVAYRCRGDTRGALVILVERNGAAGYSLAPPVACSSPGTAPRPGMSRS